MTISELRDHAAALRAERAAAALYGLDHNATYLADLQEEIEATDHALVGTAVTELASLRGELYGRLQG